MTDTATLFSKYLCEAIDHESWDSDFAPSPHDPYRMIPQLAARPEAAAIALGHLRERISTPLLDRSIWALRVLAAVVAAQWPAETRDVLVRYVELNRETLTLAVAEAVPLLLRLDRRAAETLDLHRDANYRTAFAEALQEQERARHLAALLDDPDPGVVRFALVKMALQPFDWTDPAADRLLPHVAACLPIERLDALVRSADVDVSGAAADLRTLLTRRRNLARAAGSFEMPPQRLTWYAARDFSARPGSEALLDVFLEADNAMLTVEWMRRRRSANLSMEAERVRPHLARWIRSIDDHVRSHAWEIGLEIGDEAVLESIGSPPTSWCGTQHMGGCADQRFAKGELDTSHKFCAFREYAELLRQGGGLYPAYLLAWIDRYYGLPITEERLDWLRGLGLQDDGLIAELLVTDSARIASDTYEKKDLAALRDLLDRCAGIRPEGSPRPRKAGGKRDAAIGTVSSRPPGSDQPTAPIAENTAKANNDAWNALTDAQRSSVLAALKPLLNAHAQKEKDLYASSFHTDTRVQIYASSGDASRLTLHFVFDSWEWCPAQSGSDWNYHKISGGSATFAGGALVEHALFPVSSAYIHEYEEKNYDREQAFAVARKKLEQQ